MRALCLLILVAACGGNDEPRPDFDCPPPDAECPNHFTESVCCEQLDSCYEDSSYGFTPFWCGTPCTSDDDCPPDFFGARWLGCAARGVCLARCASDDDCFAIDSFHFAGCDLEVGLCRAG